MNKDMSNHIEQNNLTSETSAYRSTTSQEQSANDTDSTPRHGSTVYSFEKVEHTHQRNNRQSLVKITMFFAGVIISLFGLYWAVINNALSVTKPTDSQPNLISDITENVYATTRSKTSLTATKNYKATLTDSVEMLRKGIASINENKTDPKNIIERFYLNSTERLTFSWSYPNGSNGSHRIITTQALFYKGNSLAGKEKIDDRLELSIYLGWIETNKASQNNYIVAQNTAVWQRSLTPFPKLETLNHSINTETIAPGQARPLDNQSLSYILLNLDRSAQIKILENTLDGLEGRLRSTGSKIEQLEREDRETSDLLESKLTNTLSGNAVYLFDISKRVMIFVLIATIIITFLKLLISEIRFMNTNITKFFNFVFAESSRHPIDDLVKIFNHFSKSDLDQKTTDNITPTSLLQEISSTIKDLTRRRE